MADPYELSARYYDRIYAWKDYRAEAVVLRGLVARECADAKTLLEVGCGTGGHLRWLEEWFAVEGVDRSPFMLDAARRKLPDVSLHEGDMRTFALERRFDVVASLFSAIGYVRSVQELQAAVGNMAAHLAPGGALMIEPWFTPEQWQPPGGVRGSMIVDDDDLKIARLVVSDTRDRFAITPMHHLVGDASGMTHFVETHELFLATAAEYEAAFVAAGLKDVRFEPNVLVRGLWIGRAR